MVTKGVYSLFLDVHTFWRLYYFLSHTHYDLLIHPLVLSTFPVPMITVSPPVANFLSAPCYIKGSKS